MVLAGIIGALYGLIILVGLDVVVKLFGYLPFDFLDILGDVSKYVVVVYAIFPALVVLYQHGFKKGIFTAITSVLVFTLLKKYGSLHIGEMEIILSAEGMATLVGAICMIVFAIGIKKDNKNEVKKIEKGFYDNIARIRKHWLILSMTGGNFMCC